MSALNLTTINFNCGFPPLFYEFQVQFTLGLSSEQIFVKNGKNYNNCKPGSAYWNNLGSNILKVRTKMKIARTKKMFWY